MRLQIKAGAGLTARHFDPEFVVVFPALLASFPETDDGYVWITCGREDHDAGLHPQDRAIDVRVHNIEAIDDEDRKRLIEKAADGLRRRLDAARGWQVLVERPGQPEAHIHIELDPQPIPVAL